MDVEFSVLVGQTLVSVEKITDDQILFKTTDGKTYRMFHLQDCCESVTIEDINGDLNDLVDSKILKAEESSNRGEVEHGDYCTWTFYHIRTMKGTVVIRWYGTSNGYYSEHADFEEIDYGN